jgi:hypothetical protein
MPVAFTSHGYDTSTANPYTEYAWADAHPSIGLAKYGVRSPLHWKVTAVAGQDRTVSIAAGEGFGTGVTDKTVDNETIQLDTISSGSRWDLIAVRRDWTPTGGQSKFVKVNGGSTKTIPGGRQSVPGNIDDQPIALVQVTAGQTQPSAIVDLRTWSGDGGGIVANDDLVRSFLVSTGTQITIGGTRWTRRVGANDTPEWVGSTPPSVDAGQSTSTPIIKAETRVFPVTNSNGDSIYTFPVAFPSALTSVVVTDAQSTGGYGAIGVKVINELTDRTRVCVRFLNPSGSALAGLTLKVSYIAVGY